jgi:xanthine/CO dehydrogenase XdhC/CoxF family maturation factor
VNELDRALLTAEDWHARGIEFALATVVGVRGSTYRGLGARQLVAADGTSIGTVSGGCLDSDLLAVAAQVMDADAPRIIEFDLTADDEAVWGWGIGCNGATELVVEPAASVMDLVAGLRKAQRPLVVVHHLGDGIGRRTLVPPATAGPYAEVAELALEEGWNRVTEIEGHRVMVEVLGAPRRLIVCGAGHDAAPLVRLGAELGYEPLVVDDRRPFLSVERFPEAAQLVHVAPGELAAAVDLAAGDSVVIMSHNYLRDLDYLEAALGHGVLYIGVLGPGERLSRLLADLAARGIEPSPQDLEALHGPAGLDIGAEGPTEIAWAVLAEIMAVRRRAGAGFLRRRKGPSMLRDYDQT